mmetsp:Transcript_12649/g.23710  ORF Transcript_12649/g.23710 Transcript_12649/m.23710 type:complete len:547 (+) Transcript_12649:135-1775(+)
MSNNCEFSDSESENEIITEEETEIYYPITSPNTPCTSLAQALQHDKEQHSFDLLNLLPSPDSDDFHEKTIATINKCRKFVQQYGDNGKLQLDDLQKFLDDHSENDEDFFLPVVQDDAFLIYIDDLEDLKRNQCSAQIEKAHMDQNETVREYQQKIQALEQQLSRVSQYLTTILDNRNGDDNDNSNVQSIKKSLTPDNDTYYFSSYSNSSIHETMLQDTVRTEAYQNAILGNPQLFKGKVVMDIGCGTGILSLFAAKAGAKKVIAIDASDMCKEAAKIVALNGYEDIITVVHGKVEDLIEKKRDMLPLEDGELVDIVISEWMGYALFFESMIPSVMVARDHLMEKTNGTMWPNHSVMFLEGASDSRLDYWSNVYGFNMDVMKDRVIKELRSEASVEIVEDSATVTDRYEIIVHDLNACRDDELDFEVPFVLKRKPNLEVEEQRIEKLVVSFDIFFYFQDCSPVSFSTGCQTKPTHWKQTSLWFDQRNSVPTLKKDEILRGIFGMRRNTTNHRDIDFLVRWEIGSPADANSTFQTKISGTIMSKLSSN